MGLLAFSFTLLRKRKKFNFLDIYLISFLTSNTAVTLINFNFQLEDTRTTDRRQTFLGYIADVVHRKFPEINDFAEELYLDGATTGKHPVS